MAEGVKINLAEKLAQFQEHWHPKLIETVDDYEIKVVKLKGDFVWHRHAGEDELFLVVRGRFRMDFRDRQVDVGAGEVIVVPRGVEHRPYAEEECEIVLLERRGVINTGDAAPGELTRNTLEKI
jgi:mannose-6-phosphate isomerase-like protein (cupin superfamily)